MSVKLFDSELKVMEVIWDEGEVKASRIATVLGDKIGWNVNTTYTVIKKCIAKGAVERRDPGFICRALVTKEEIRADELTSLMEKLFDGSPKALAATLLSGKVLTKEEIAALRELVNNEAD